MSARKGVAPVGPLAFSYCETVFAAAAATWHIRARHASVPLEPHGGLHEETLCGRDLAGGWDIDGRRVSDNDLVLLGAGVCRKCAFVFYRLEMIAPNRRRDALLDLAVEHGLVPVPSRSTPDCWMLRLDEFRVLTVYGEDRHAVTVTLLDDDRGEYHDITQRTARDLIVARASVTAGD